MEKEQEIQNKIQAEYNNLLSYVEKNKEEVEDFNQENWEKIYLPLVYLYVEKLKTLNYTGVNFCLLLDPSLDISLYFSDGQRLCIAVSLVPFEENEEEISAFAYFENEQYVYGGLLSFDKVIAGTKHIKHLVNTDKI